MTILGNERKTLTETLYLVRLMGTEGHERISLGVFWAVNPQAAETIARRKYRGMFRRLELPGWSVRVTETSPNQWQAHQEALQRPRTAPEENSVIRHGLETPCDSSPVVVPTNGKVS